jgi:hypothetical protein
MNSEKPKHFDSENTGIDSDKSRRSFLKKAAAATVVITNTDLFAFSKKSFAKEVKTIQEIPWYKRVTRWGQTNITEKDPAHYDIVWWRKYWKRTQTQGVIVNAGGIVAYYPSRIPLHRQAQYLEGRDLFGDLCRAAHEDGLVVFARMDSNRAHEEFYKAHPDWFAIDGAGNPYKSGDLYITCVNSPYYNEHIPAILKEVSDLYHPEGFTDNSWSGLGRDSICYCDNCKKSFRDKTGKDIPRTRNWDDQTYRQWIRWNYDRRLEIWDMNNRITIAAGGKNCIWSGMNGGSISGQAKSFRDFKAICDRADIIMLDSQARNDADGFQENSSNGKRIHGMLGWDKLIPESMAMYQAGKPTFRIASKPKAEARMWMIEGIAGGIQPWWHFIGASHEDRRIYHTPESLFNWHKINEKYLINRTPVATIGVIWSQQNMDFYGREETEQMVDLPWRGMIQALIRSRIPYIPVHADHIEREAARLSVLILPNLGILTESQIINIRNFVEKGGGLIATGESSLYDELGDPRSDFALGDLFGAHHAGTNQTTKGSNYRKRVAETSHTYLRISPELRRDVDGPQTGLEPIVSGKRHPVLKGFEETDIISYGGFLDAIKTDATAEVLMTFIPSFPIYPPETAWMREPKTDIPGLIVNSNSGKGRVVYMPADLDRQYGRNNLPDHGDLLANIVRWASKDDIPLVIGCAGLIDSNLFQQKDRMILHLVNLTSAGTWRQPVDELIPIGPVKVSVRLNKDVTGRALNSLVSAQKIISRVEKGWVHFTINTISDQEVVVVS